MCPETITEILVFGTCFSNPILIFSFNYLHHNENLHKSVKTDILLIKELPTLLGKCSSPSTILLCSCLL